MNFNKIPAKNKKDGFNVVVEIPMRSENPVKYEFDKDSGALVVDRFMQVSMSYPCNYGFIPHTLSEDGDPVDVMVATQYPLQAGCVLAVRPVAVLLMEDESGMDEKILAYPVSKLDHTFDSIKDVDDIAPFLKERIKHFFEHYKALEKGKWVKIKGWEGAKKASELIEQAIKRHSNT